MLPVNTFYGHVSRPFNIIQLTRLNLAANSTAAAGWPNSSSAWVLLWLLAVDSLQLAAFLIAPAAAAAVGKEENRWKAEPGMTGQNVF